MFVGRVLIEKRKGKRKDKGEGEKARGQRE